MQGHRSVCPNEKPVNSLIISEYNDLASLHKLIRILFGNIIY